MCLKQHGGCFPKLFKIDLLPKDDYLCYMFDVIVYDSAEKKNQLEAEYAKGMPPIERLKLYLDLVDLYRNFKSKEIHDREDDGIEWIILERKSTNGQRS